MNKQESFRLLNMLGGDSIFTLESKKTGMQYSYIIQKTKYEKSKSPASKFVKTYSVKISEDGNKYYYAGCVRHDSVVDIFQFKTNRESYYKVDSKPVKALLWALKNVGSYDVAFYNHNKCCVCFGELRDKRDKEVGYHSSCENRGETLK